MASNINANNIDGTFPVAGVDNDSQGFRTNFTNIKSNLTYAKIEISDLQSKAVLKSALTGGSLDNDFAGALISNADVKGLRESRYDFGTVTGTVTLNYNNGHYQTVTTSGSVSLAFSNLPAAGMMGRLRLELTISNIAHTVTLPAAVSLGVTGLAGYNATTDAITFTETGVYILEFTSDDAGTTIHVADLTRPRDYFYSQQIRLAPRVISDARGQAFDVGGMIAVDTSVPALWVSTGAYDGTTLIWRRVELETRANEVALSANRTSTSSSLADISGLDFIAEEGVRYRFEAYIPFAHSASATNTHTFSVGFSQGVCNYTIEQQAGPAVAPTVNTLSTSDATTSAVVTSSTAVKICRITGTYFNASADRERVAMRFATSAGTLTVQAGAYLRFNRV
jgi:hypothetical protein